MLRSHCDFVDDNSGRRTHQQNFVPAFDVFIRDLWRQVFVPKNQDRAGRSCYPTPSNSGSSGQLGSNRGLNAGVGRRGATRAAPFLISLVLFVLPIPPDDKPPEHLTTVLLPMRVGSIWRVQIVWPNGSVHYYGTFASKESAIAWISTHSWLSVRPKPPGDPPA